MTHEGDRSARLAAALVALLLAGAGLWLLTIDPQEPPAPRVPEPGPAVEAPPPVEVTEEPLPTTTATTTTTTTEPGRRRVVGRVIDWDGRPAGQAEVSWERGEERGGASADPEGGFELELPADVREVVVTPWEDARRCRLALDGPTVELRLEQAADLRVELAPDSAPDAPGTQSTHAAIMAELAQDDWTPGWQRVDAFHHADFSFERTVELRGLPPGRYRLLVWREGSDPESGRLIRPAVGEAAVELRLGENRAVVRLVALATITGKITRPGGGPQGALMRAVPVDVTWAIFDHPEITWNLAGGYGLPEYRVELPPGRWRLVAWTRGERLAAGEQVVELAAGEARRCDLTLPAERRLVVRWEPPLEAGAELLLSGPPGFLAESPWGTEELVLRGLPPDGVVHVLARGERLGAQVSVRAGGAVTLEPLATADLELIPAEAGLEVVLVPAWPAGDLCQFLGPVGAEACEGFDLEPVAAPLRATTDAQGIARFERVPAGAYRVRVAGRCLAEGLDVRAGVRAARTLRR